MRDKRSQLTSAQQISASLALRARLIQDPMVQSAQYIAAYLPQNGEPDLMPFIQWAWQQQKILSLPVVHPEQAGKMRFHQYQVHTSLVTNQYGILEPDPGKTQCLDDQLEVLLIPLVAFDSQGQRLGMGGGYYDRAIERLRANNPELVLYGIAHDCQRVDRLFCEPWDIPMQKIFTEKALASN